MVNNMAASAAQGKSPVPNSLSVNSTSVKKVNTPKINFVGVWISVICSYRTFTEQIIFILDFYLFKMF